MKYKVPVKESPKINEVLETLSKDPEITFVYAGDTIYRVHVDDYGIAWDKLANNITVVGPPESYLVRKFNDLVHEKSIKLEKVW